ncbi:carboxymuconolactone decarboxylase family protein [Acrocarpospora sp. B8E8]|uniref:carboxymuconolactone decarboxylase family protein n=1 Tax=Acrocarpospora sp. B8E8 TaxID=3153572 RepID=UPI00325E68EF
MARIPVAALDAAGSDVLRRVLDRRGGALRPLDKVLLHSPPLADGWNGLLGAIRGGLALPAFVRELVILRIAVLNRASYEWVAHEPVARRAGLSDAQLTALRAGDLAPFDERTRAVLAYTDAMTLQVDVAPAVFDAVRAHFDDARLVELTGTIAAYNMVSRFVVALGVTEVDR